MAINLGAPINVSDPDLYRVQQRSDKALTQLANSPWGTGNEVDGLRLLPATGVQTISVTHNLGRAPKGVIILNSPVEVSQPYNVIAQSANSANFDINVVTAPAAGSTINVWVI